MLVQLLLVLYSANVEADNYAAYDKYSQGIVDHAGAAAQYHNTGNTEAASTPPRLFYNFRLLSPFFSLLAHTFPRTFSLAATPQRPLSAL